MLGRLLNVIDNDLSFKFKICKVRYCIHIYNIGLIKYYVVHFLLFDKDRLSSMFVIMIIWMNYCRLSLGWQVCVMPNI